MNLKSYTGRALSAALIAGTVGAAVIPSTAEAGRRTATAVGVGLAAGALGLAVGSAAARDREEVYYDDAPRYRRVYRAAPRCWYEDHERVNRWGDVRVRRVRVCE